MIVDTGTAVCDPPCTNGVCIDPGLCYCDRGWTGLDCLKGTINIRAWSLLARVVMMGHMQWFRNEAVT